MENRFEIIVANDKSAHWSLENLEFKVAIVFVDYNVGEVRVVPYTTEPPKKASINRIKRMLKDAIDYDMMVVNEDGAEFDE